MPRKTRPWKGNETPGTRLRTTAAKARAGLENVNTPGVRDIGARVSHAVTESRALVEALEHIAREGFRRRASETPIGAEEVQGAVEAVRDTLGALAEASAATLSERYAAFAATLDTVLGLADAAQHRGVAGSGAITRDDPWKAFEDWTESRRVLRRLGCLRRLDVTGEGNGIDRPRGAKRALAYDEV